MDEDMYALKLKIIAPRQKKKKKHEDSPNLMIVLAELYAKNEQ